METIFVTIMAMLVVYVIVHFILIFGAAHQSRKGHMTRAMWMLDQAIRFYPRPKFAISLRSAIQANYFHDYKSTIYDCNQIIRFDDTLAETYNNRGFAYFRLGKSDPAMKDLDNALALKPELVIAYINRSNLHRRLGDFEAAIADCDEAIQYAPKNFNLYVQLSFIYYSELKDYESALNVCKEASKNGLAPVYVHLLRAEILQRQLGIESAMDDLDKAIELMPLDPQVLIWCGNLFDFAHDYQKSIEYYNKALEQLPRGEQILTYRGNAYWRSGDYDNAKGDFAKAIEINPNVATTYNYRARMLAVQGHYAKSLDDANHSIQLEVVEKDGYNTRGQTHFLMGNYAEALADFEKSEELKKGDVYALVGQAVTHHAMGDAEVANQLWQKAIKTDSKYKDVQAFADDFSPADLFMDAVRDVVKLSQSPMISES
jgi:tetratricopeptide (TPR) repeat protein